MPRHARNFVDGGIYHISHRCHNREFLFKFVKHRDIYVEQLYETSCRFAVDILDYIVTSNHVHLLLTAKKGSDISQALQYLHGSVARKYNIAKCREGSFWSNRFYSTRIQPRGHIGRCLLYITRRSHTTEPYINTK